MKKLLKWIGAIAVIIVLIAGSFYLLLRSDYAGRKLSTGLSTHLGRRLSIEGPLRIDWDWNAPRIHATNLRIANVPRASPPDMVEIDEIDFTVKIWKLLRGRLELPDISILRPHIFLIEEDEAHKNWDFPALSGANIAAKAALPQSRSNVPVIDSLRIQEGKVSYKNIPRKVDLDLDMDTAKGKNAANQLFAFKGSGTLEGQALNITAQGGSLQLLRDTHKPFPLNLTLSIGATRFSTDGTFIDPVQLEGLNANLHLSGKNLADLFYLMHIPFPPTPAYDLQGHLDKEGKKWTFSPFTGRVGHSDLSGSVVYDTSGKLPLLKGALASNRLDVADLGGLIGLSPERKGAPPNGRILPDTPLDLKRLRAGDMDLTLKAEKLNAPGWPLNDMNTHIVLKNGLLTLNPLHFGVAEGKAEGSLVLDGRKDIPGVEMNIALRELSLKPFFEGSKFAAFSEGHFGGRLDLAGTGASLATILGDSNGHIIITTAGGKISLLLVEAVNLNIAKMLPLFFGKDKTTAIRCGLGDFSVNDGLLTSRIFVLDTEHTKLKGDARISLKDETINAAIEARPKDLSLLSLQSRILVKGKLHSPTVTIDPIPTGIRGAAAAALAVIAPPAAILPFIEPGSGNDADCAALFLHALSPEEKTAPAPK